MVYCSPVSLDWTHQALDDPAHEVRQRPGDDWGQGAVAGVHGGPGTDLLRQKQRVVDRKHGGGWRRRKTF